MSRVKGRGVAGPLSSTTSRKTILQLIAASNHRVSNVFFTVSFEGVTPTDPPIEVDVVKQTDGGTGSALTLVKDGSDPETLQTTARHTITVEPTTTDIKHSVFVHPQTREREIGPFVIFGGERLALRVLAANAVDVIVSTRFEE